MTKVYEDYRVWIDLKWFGRWVVMSREGEPAKVPDTPLRKRAILLQYEASRLPTAEARQYVSKICWELCGRILVDDDRDLRNALVYTSMIEAIAYVNRIVSDRMIHEDEMMRRVDEEHRQHRRE